MELETGYNGMPGMNSSNDSLGPAHLFGTHPDLLSQQFPSGPFFTLTGNLFLNLQEKTHFP